MEIDNSDMFLLQLEYRNPINFVCKKCVDVSEIPNEISIRKSSAKTILNDLTVSDVIFCEKSLSRKAPMNPKGSERDVQVYK